MKIIEELRLCPDSPYIEVSWSTPRGLGCSTLVAVLDDLKTLGIEIRTDRPFASAQSYFIARPNGSEGRTLTFCRRMSCHGH
jgi:hypothetical protein